MGPIRLIAAVGILAQASISGASPAGGARPGEGFTISVDREMSGHTNRGSSSSSTDQDSYIEQIVAVRPDGLELNFDLAPESEEDRADTWQLPTRVLRPGHGRIQLLNRAELEGRRDRWLKRGKMDSAACGHWIFTWNTFKIECDPESALDLIRHIDLDAADIREGALYHDPAALAPMPLRRTANGLTGAIFSARLEIDPEKVRREAANGDVVVAGLSNRKLTPEDALKAHAGDKISGSITVTFDVDSGGKPWRKESITKVETIKPDGQISDNTVDETIQRKPSPGGRGARIVASGPLE